MVSRYPRITDKEKFSSGLERLQEHLNDIAGDPGGSDPEPYVSENDIAFFNRIREGAKRLGWKGATPITHRETTPRWIPGRKKIDEKVYFYDPEAKKGEEKVKEVKGYRIGYLNVAQFEAPVFLCNDGRLRMLIKHNRPERRGLRAGRSFRGYCRLPDPELIYPVRTRGTMAGVSYNHGQTNILETELKTLTGYTFR